MIIELKKIDKTNYEECITLKVSDKQKHFVASNQRSLVQSAYEPEMYPLGVFQNNKMVGFILYDFDVDLNGWSMSRFMIDFKYQKTGIGTESLLKFMDYFIKNHGNKPIYTSAEVDNQVALNMYKKIGFREKEIFEYQHNNLTYREVRLLKNL